MLYKLLKHGITGNVYNIIKSMYENPRYCVMVNGKASPYFTSSYGVKQGCSMSPILSNIFQNDLQYEPKKFCRRAAESGRPLRAANRRLPSPSGNGKVR